MKNPIKKRVEMKRNRLLMEAKSAIEAIVQFKDPSYEETIADLEDIQYTVEGFIEGFNEDIRNFRKLKESI